MHPLIRVACTAALTAASTVAWATLPSPAPSGDVRAVQEWVRKGQDNGGQPYAVIDKKNAAIHVFDGQGAQRGASPVLLGLARGDDSVPGIGERPMKSIQPHERTTPAGRFVTEPGVNTGGEDIVWIDYDAAVSMHRVRTANAQDRRLQRLASRTVADNRISYGCVNVPADFYDRVIKPLFGQNAGVVYVLPETRPLASLLPR